MKTLKYAMVAVLVACTMVSLASADGFKTKPKFNQLPVVSISFSDAVKIPGLVAAMHQQLNPGFLSNNQLFYTQRVVWSGKVYMIKGIYVQWYRFFYAKKVPTPKIEPGIL